MISANQVKQFRKKTGASIMECKKALEKSKGDEKQALNFLNQRGKNIALKKSARKAKEGIVDSYIHSNKKMGVLLELNCETDFVARNEEFKKLVHDITIHIAGMDSKDEKSLLKEPFVKNPEITIKDLIEEKIAKLGENIKIGRFIKYEL